MAENAMSECTSGDPAPLSIGQLQMWLFSQLIPETSVYNESVTVRLSGLLNVPALEQSLNEVIRRHEVWRTGFPLVDGQPVQKVYPPFPIVLPVIDLRHLPMAEREPEAIRLATEQALPRFDLATPPLLRAKLIRLEDEEHRLYLALHHLIFDRSTLSEVFLPELSAHYEAFSQGKALSFPPLPLQYADFAVWQRKLVQGDVLREQLVYWKKQLANAPATLDLPVDRPRQQVQSYRGAQCLLRLSKDLTDAIKRLSHEEGVTLNMTLVAALQALLSRYTGQTDILVGMQVGHSNSYEVKDLIGLFVNMLVLRTDLSGNSTFRELLGRVREVMQGANAHSDVPFEYLLKELQPERNVGQNPLFQVMLSVDPPLPELSCGWSMTFTDVDTQTAKFDLSIVLEDRPEGLVGRFEYSSDLFEAATITRMVGHWQTLLESIVRDPSRRIEVLPILTEMEQEQFLSWNNTAQDYPQDQCVHHLFEAQVKQTPDDVALIFEETQLTYRELNCKANQVAHVLQTMGVGPDTLVGIYMERSFEMVIALIAVLKAGGAYVPLEPTYPAKRIAYMMQDAALSIVLTQRHLREQLPRHDASILCLDQDWQLFAQQSTHNPTSAVQPENMIYMFYTSGSTGSPKGVMNIHHALVNRLHGTQQEYQLTATDRVLQIAPFAFDASVKEFFWPLISGATLVIARPRGHQDPAYLISLIQQYQITVLNFGPLMLQMLLMQSEVEHCTSLRYVICGGEALSADLQSHFFATFSRSDISLHNLYGPTEAAIEVSRWICQRDSRETTVPIGYPLSNVQFHILSHTLQRVPIGVAGELHIGGVCLARGYFNQPELTREKFIPDPFVGTRRGSGRVGSAQGTGRGQAPSVPTAPGRSLPACSCPQPGARLYRTGDLARYRPDGAIEFLGRLDFQVKLRGFRIEPGEIEAVLSQHTAVQQAVVVVREDTPGEALLVAYVVVCEGQSATVSDLHDYMRKQLPVYMVPSAYVQMETLPLTPNGKVDRCALPKPDTVRTEVEGTFVAPTTLVQQQLVEIWEELLNRQPIGIRESFFDLGGHSFLAMCLFNRIEQVCGKRLSFSTLLREPTIEHLAEALRSEEKTGSRVSVTAVQAHGSKPPFFYLHGDWRGGGVYCLNLARSLGAEQPFYVLDLYKFDGLQVLPTFEEMVAAHVEVVRTVQSEGPYQLGGYCCGGLMAYEMARQLQASGQEVDLLVLMDPHLHLASRRLVRSAMGWIADLIGFSPEKQFRWFLHLQHLYRYIRFTKYRQVDSTIHLEILSDRGSLGDCIFSIFPQLNKLFPATKALCESWYTTYDWIALNYNPQPYPGKIIFFWNKKDSWRSARWKKLVAAKKGEVRVYSMPGDHISSRTTYVSVLAEYLRDCLCKANVDRLC